MTPLKLPAIRNCLEGIVPSVLATADASGTPNVSLISQVQYVDPEHVALSYQFFNKTRRNLLTTKRASVAVVDPDTNAQYRLTLEYLETQTSGPLFEAMRAKLAGIASHSGMQGVFRLLGSDVFRVQEIEALPSTTMPQPIGLNLLSAARRACEQIATCDELGELFDAVLAGLQQHFGIEHSMVMMLDRTTDRLYTVASRGYPVSGIGSEVGLGEGVIGVAAAQCVPIRIGRMASEYSYGTAIRDTARAAGLHLEGNTAIPYPGLKAPQSQIAMPILHDGSAIGVLFAESAEPNQFGYEEEDALSLVASHLSALSLLLQQEEAFEKAPSRVAPGEVTGREIRIRHYRADNTVFVGNDYLIKGVAGAILWKIAQERAEGGRIEFTNRELRLDPALRLPEYAENLEARLVLLQRRLCERDAGIAIEKCGRGRFRFLAEGRLVLEEI
ncbi:MULTISPECIES: GAF domain-containing protein [Chelativorans]|jgi:GAF domain-containing protein|uniref:Putative GAF sensor protein n=1 Tax=Chelativorans sp. (strain BNC1) TaxID=266779 RepID=Q11LH1_CHESB|nr:MULTISPECIES: GAF domain-containing protein [Chelativorans]